MIIYEDDFMLSIGNRCEVAPLFAARSDRERKSKGAVEDTERRRGGGE